MKNTEIKNLSVEELQNKLAEIQGEYQKLRLAHNISPIENTIQIRGLRKTIARIKTELTNKQ